MEEIHLTEKEHRIAQLLLKYMQKNPEAKHTADGIARWWIMQQRFEEELKVVEKIVRYLIEQGILQEITLPQNQKSYKIISQSVIHFSNEIEEEYI